jgi:hypothetical protein
MRISLTRRPTSASRHAARAAVMLREHAGELTQPRSVVADPPPQFPATGIYQGHIMVIAGQSIHK